MAIADNRKSLRCNHRSIREAVSRALARKEMSGMIVGVALVDDRTIAELNEKFLHHKGPTDVIAFRLDNGAPDGFFGEIVVSTETALREARRRRIAVEEELLRYCVHGALHLAGYDDRTSAQRKRMWAAQERVVAACLKKGKAIDGCG